LLSSQIRTRFLEYFQARDHLLVPSAPLVPEDDPSLLLVGAGMVPFKPYFLGRKQPPAPRLTSCQRAFRAVDIEEVGNSTRHDTFFEMLGNFSFGSYFKEEAIRYAYQFLTEEMGLDPDRMHYSIHPSDKVSERLWQEVAGVGPERIVALEDNYWQAGPTGPFGVDSEIYFDLGPEYGSAPQEAPGRGERYLEIWNLVFMDSERLPDGSSVPLPRPGVDTGMGLERITRVVQGKSSIFDTDLFAPLVQDFRSRAAAADQLGEDAGRRHLWILADHSRGACALISDGVRPSNEGRGYVLRRLLRRALVSAQALRLTGGLAPAAQVVAQILKDPMPQLGGQLAEIESVLREEEARFAEVLDRGLGLFLSLAAEGTGITAADAFRLHDTFGFPIELTRDLAASRGLDVDTAGFELLLEEQRLRGRGPVRTELPALPASEFVGYEQMEVEAQVELVLSEGRPVERLDQGQRGEVVLNRSPFYPEGGGQVGDRGRLTWPDGAAEVEDTRSGGPGSQLVTCRVTSGQLWPGLVVRATVDPDHRRGCAAHHSATHLVNSALRLVLGPEVAQRGSLVTPDHATFDFSWPRPLTPEEVLEVERRVNEAVRQDLPRQVELLTLEEARRSGAISLEGETYREPVRVVSFPGFSRELCGGTHVAASGQLGAVVLTGERSVGQGLRRLELRSGSAAERWWETQRELVQQTALALGSPQSEVPGRVANLLERARGLERALREASQGRGGAETYLSFPGGELPVHDSPLPMERAEMRRLGERLAERSPSGSAAVLAGGTLLVLLGAPLTGRGLAAGDLAKTVCSALGGAGGGRPELGQGTLPEGEHAAAIRELRNILEKLPEEA
jgi:alanyl-tRNA synthetase